MISDPDATLARGAQRALTELDVRFASDNVRDVFYPYGDADLLEAAWLGAISAQVDEEDALLAAIAGGRSRLEVGQKALDFRAKLRHGRGTALPSRDLWQHAGRRG